MSAFSIDQGKHEFVESHSEKRFLVWKVTFSAGTTLECSPDKELTSPAYFPGVFSPNKTPVLGKSLHKRKSSGCASGLESTEGGGGCSVTCSQHSWGPGEKGGQLLARVL